MFTNETEAAAQALAPIINAKIEKFEADPTNTQIQAFGSELRDDLVKGKVAEEGVHVHHSQSCAEEGELVVPPDLPSQVDSDSHAAPPFRSSKSKSKTGSVSAGSAPLFPMRKEP